MNFGPVPSTVDPDCRVQVNMLTIDSAGDLWTCPGAGTSGSTSKGKVKGGCTGAVAVFGLEGFDGDRCPNLA